MITTGKPTASPSRPAEAGPSAAAVICYDRDLTVRWRNETATTLAGRALAEQLGAPSCLADLGPHHCGPGCPVLLARSDGHSHTAEFTFADGRTRRVRAEPMFDAQGAPAGVMEFIEELPMPTATAEPAEDVEWRSVFDSVNDAIFVHDAATGGILQVNATASRMYGYTAEEMGSRSISELSAGTPPYSEAEALGWLQRAQTEGPQLFEWQARARDGHLFWVEIGIRAGRGSPAARIFVTVRDITQRKLHTEERERVAEALRQSEERFRLLLGRVPTIAVQGYGPDGTVRYWNEASERLYGYTAAEALGRNLIQLIIPPTMRDEVRVAVHQMCTSGLPLPPAEIQLQRKDGSLVPVFSSHAVVQLPGGSPELYCFDFDLTERKQAEAERLELERRLLQTQKLESLGVLAGGIAHDFNNLLTGVLGNLELSLVELPAGHGVRPLIDDAVFAARRAADLTRQMLAYSGRSHFQQSTLDLNAIVREQEPLLHAAVSRRAQLQLLLEPELPAIEADPEQLGQLLVNLVTNAAESIEQTPGTVEVRTGCEDFCSAERLEASRLTEKPAPQRFAFLEVADTGAGIDAATEARIFDPFFTTKFTGRGLGLPVVLGIVRAHQGALFVDSVPGRGTVVRVLLPLARPPAPAAVDTASAPTGESAMPPAGVLLLVDDEEQVRRIAQRMGRRLGIEVITAVDGESGVELCRQHATAITCAMIDLTMPGMNGIDCLRALHAIRPDLPAVLSSGFAEEQISERFGETGFTVFLQKPFTFDQFTDSLRRASANLAR